MGQTAWDPTTEEKKSACARMEAEGREEQFRNLQRRYKYGKVDGKTHYTDASFRLALRHYPPLDDPAAIALSEALTSESDDGIELVEAHQQVVSEAASRDREQEKRIASQVEELGKEVSNPDFDRDFEWAYSNFENTSVEPKSAPGAGAWGMLMFCRSNRAKFMDTAVKYFRDKKEKSSEHEEVRSDDLRERLSVIDRLLSETGMDVSLEIINLVASDAGAVGTALRGLGWEVRRPDET